MSVWDEVVCGHETDADEENTRHPRNHTVNGLTTNSEAASGAISEVSEVSPGGEGSAIVNVME